MTENKKKQRNTSYMIFTALFAAMICIFTAYVGHIPTGLNGGYLHFGDALIYLSACLLPTPYAISAAILGGGLADLFTAPNWILPTVIIKAGMVLAFTYKKNKILCKRNIVALLPAMVLTVCGYYVAEAIMYGNWAAPALSVIANLIQSGGSMVIFFILGAILDKMHIKERIFS